MNTHLESGFDVTNTYSVLGELAENPLHFEPLSPGEADEEGFAEWNEPLECGALSLHVEWQGARLA